MAELNMTLFRGTHSGLSNGTADMMRADSAAVAEAFAEVAEKVAAGAASSGKLQLVAGGVGPPADLPLPPLPPPTPPTPSRPPAGRRRLRQAPPAAADGPSASADGAEPGAAQRQASVDGPFPPMPFSPAATDPFGPGVPEGSLVPGVLLEHMAMLGDTNPVDRV
jgi:hypothetical protein